MFKFSSILLTTCLICSFQRQNGSKDSLIEEPSPLSTNNVDGKPATKIVKTVQVSRFKVETWLMNWRWWMDFGLWKVRICFVCKRRNWSRRGGHSFKMPGSAACLRGRPSNGFITNTILVEWLIEDKLPDRQPKPKVFAKLKDQQLHFQKMNNNNKKLLQQNRLHGLLCNWIALFQEVTVNWHDQDQMLQDK